MTDAAFLTYKRSDWYSLATESGDEMASKKSGRSCHKDWRGLLLFSRRAAWLTCRCANLALNAFEEVHDAPGVHSGNRRLFATLDAVVKRANQISEALVGLQST